MTDSACLIHRVGQTEFCNFMIKVGTTHATREHIKTNVQVNLLYRLFLSGSAQTCSIPFV